MIIEYCSHKKSRNTFYSSHMMASYVSSQLTHGVFCKLTVWPDFYHLCTLYRDAIHTFYWMYDICLPIGPWEICMNYWMSNFLILVVDDRSVFCEMALGWISLDFTDDESILVQVTAWSYQATNHYLIQCWSKFMSPYGVTRPQRINDSIHTCDWTKSGI